MIRSERIFRAISNLFGLISLAFLLFLMFAITLDVSVRAITDRPISGIFEMSEIALVIIVFLGLGWTQMDDGHIRVTALTDLAPPRLAQTMMGLSCLVASVIFLLLAWPSTEDAMHSFSIREFRWGHIQLPIWWAKILLAVGLWFGAAQMAFYAVMHFCGYSGLAERPRSATLKLETTGSSHG